MAILSLQRRLAEVGRIRLGHQVEMKGGKKRPAALATFRLTSGDEDRIKQAAHLYGGNVTKWEAPNGLPAWEVITQANKLPVVVPPSQMAFSQHFELWSGGGCQRRCDGVTEIISEQPCLCDPATRQCDVHTRLSVLLRDMSGLGVWRVDTQGWYAAVELQGAVEIIALAAGKGQMLPATLRLDPRTIKREGEGTKRFVVPVLDVDVSPAQLLGGGMSAPIDAPALPAAPRGLTPVPSEGSVRAPSIADQMANAEPPNRRRSAPIPSTGIAPRTAAQARTRQQAEHRQQEEQASDPWGPSTPPDPEEDAYRRMEDARDAADTTQDSPRMCTRNQLTKLNILLNKLDFDKSDAGRAAKLDFCSAAIQSLMPDSPYAARPITSSKDFTFEEAGKLIEFLEAEEKAEQERRDTPTQDAAVDQILDGDDQQQAVSDTMNAIHAAHAATQEDAAGPDGGDPWAARRARVEPDTEPVDAETVDLPAESDGTENTADSATTDNTEPAPHDDPESATEDGSTEPEASKNDADGQMELG